MGLLFYIFIWTFESNTENASKTTWKGSCNKQTTKNCCYFFLATAKYLRLASSAIHVKFHWNILLGIKVFINLKWRPSVVASMLLLFCIKGFFAQNVIRPPYFVSSFPEYGISRSFFVLKNKNEIFRSIKSFH